MTVLPLLLALLSLHGVRAADTPTKEFVLNDGTHVVGVVLDEGQAGYLVRTSAGTVRVPYDVIVNVNVVAPGTPSPAPSATAPASPMPPSASDYISVDGFHFPTADAKSTYEIQRCKLDVLDGRSGTWRQESESHIAPLSANGSSVSSGAGQYSDTVVAQYRISTGEGVVLATFAGPMLYQSQRLFQYLGAMDAWNRHAHADGASEAARRAHKVMEGASAGVVVAGVITDIASVAVAASQQPGSASKGPVAGIATGMVLVGTGLMWNIGNHIPAAGHMVEDPWNVEEVMPYVRAYNNALRKSLSAPEGPAVESLAAPAAKSDPLPASTLCADVRAMAAANLPLAAIQASVDEAGGMPAEALAACMASGTP